jgi:hypothetical protein
VVPSSAGALISIVGALQVVTESDFWTSLEFRLCREFDGFPENDIRFLWCDGFTPEEYLLEEEPRRITGRAWIGSCPKEEQWEFTLIMNHPAHSHSSIRWEILLPRESVTGWLSIDLPRKRIQIDPVSAVARTG